MSSPSVLTENFFLPSLYALVAAPDRDWETQKGRIIRMLLDSRTVNFMTVLPISQFHARLVEIRELGFETVSNNREMLNSDGETIRYKDYSFPVEKLEEYKEKWAKIVK